MEHHVEMQRGDSLHVKLVSTEEERVKEQTVRLAAANKEIAWLREEVEKLREARRHYEGRAYPHIEQLERVLKETRELLADCNADRDNQRVEVADLRRKMAVACRSHVAVSYLHKIRVGLDEVFPITPKREIDVPYQLGSAVGLLIAARREVLRGYEENNPKWERVRSLIEGAGTRAWGAWLESTNRDGTRHV